MLTHGRLFMSRGVLAIAIVGIVTSCGSAEFGGNAQTRHQTPSVSGASDASKGSSFLSVDVAYELEAAAGLSLVDNAMSGYKADLLGGSDCWGTQATPYVGDTAKPGLKVRKGATGCIMVFSELNFKDPSVVILKNAAGLRSNDTTGAYLDYASDDDKTILAVKVASTLSTSADSVVKLTGRIAKVVTEQTTTASEELSVSAQGDVVAYPNVNISGTPLMFRNAIRVTLVCATNSNVASSCVPAILPQANGAASPQPFAQMDAALAVLKGAVSTGFPGSLSQTGLDSLFAAGNKINNVAQGLSNVAPPVIKTAPSSVEFKDMNLPAVASGDKVVLVVRYYETVNNVKTYTYKVFRIGL